MVINLFHLWWICTISISGRTSKKSGERIQIDKVSFCNLLSKLCCFSVCQFLKSINWSNCAKMAAIIFFLKTRRLRRGYHKGIHELVQDLRACIEQAMVLKHRSTPSFYFPRFSNVKYFALMGFFFFFLCTACSLPHVSCTRLPP